MVERRVAGIPLEHILGWVDFCGLRIAVSTGVFVPRQRTQLLVRQAAALARPGSVVVDLCCGAGAIGLAIAATAGAVDLHAVDVDPVCADCARRNLAGVGTVHEGDLYAPLPTELRGCVDVLVANAPYVPTDEIALMPPEARSHEPRLALDGGDDGLDVQRRIAAGATDWLAPGGHLLMETSERQASSTAEAFRRGGLAPRIVGSADLHATVVVGARADSR